MVNINLSDPKSHILIETSSSLFREYFFPIIVEMYFASLYIAFLCYLLYIFVVCTNAATVVLLCDT